MHALHHDDDGAGLLVIEARQQRVVVPGIDAAALCFRVRVDRLQRIVDDDEIAAASGQGAADRGRQTEAALRQFNLAFAVFLADDRVWENRTVPGCGDDRAFCMPSMPVSYF